MRCYNCKDIYLKIVNYLKEIRALMLNAGRKECKINEYKDKVDSLSDPIM